MNKVNKIVTRLELDGYIQENRNGSYSKIKDGSTYNNESVEPLILQARHQYQEVKDFLKSDKCLMSILLKHFNQEVENDFKCNKCSSCIDDPIFMTPNRSDVETIPEIFELEENYIQETPVAKKELNEKEEIEAKPLLQGQDLDAPKYKLLADGYIDHPLAKELRTYSKEESTKRNQPSFAVFPKKVVNEIVNKRPMSIEELKDITGLSDNKIEEFGEDIIKMVIGFEEE